jgi:membrane dipeptidase
MPELPLVVDSHEDIASSVLMVDRDFLLDIKQLRAFAKEIDKEGTPTVCLPELIRGNVRIVFATLWVSPAGYDDSRIDSYRNSEEAHAKAQEQLRYYRELERDGRIRIIENRNQLEEHLESENPRVGIVILMEGADPIRMPSECREWFDAGVRIVGPAWRQTRYAGGTRTPGPLTSNGRELMSEMESCGMILDTSHLAEQSFYDAFDLFHGTIIASHSNCRSFVTTDRQLSDEMIKKIVSRKNGVIGTVLYNTFLDPNWVQNGKKKSDVTLANVIKHMNHICEIAGDRTHVGIGSDFDGGFGLESTPAEFDTVADLQKLGPALRQSGFSETEAAGVLGNNWIRTLRQALP